MDPVRKWIKREDKSSEKKSRENIWMEMDPVNRQIKKIFGGKLIL